MTVNEKTLTELAKAAAERLSVLRAEAALQVHLAGMDVKSAWAEVSPQVEALEHRIEELVGESTTGQAKLDLHLALMDVRDRWHAIEPRVEGVAGEAKAGIQRAFEEMTAAIERLRKGKAP